LRLIDPVAPTSDHLSTPLMGKEVIDCSNGLVGQSTERVSIEIAEIGICDDKSAPKVSQWVVLIEF
jgi:hypothetical protein